MAIGDGFTTENTLKVSERYVTKKYWTEKVMGETWYDAGGLWAWGYNNNGQLGLGDTTPRNSPVQVGSLTNWKVISKGYLPWQTLAIKTDGTLWGWGHNNTGQLGLGDTVHRSSPVQVGSLTNWNMVTTSLHTMAIKTDGTLWACGYNLFGNFGLGDTVNRSSLTQVGSLTNWKEVYCGSYHTVAVKTDGTLWAWGANFNGELGDGTTVHKSSPVQIGSLTNWKSVSAGGYEFTMAIKTDGTLWGWGTNTNGQLGLGDTVNRSSPVQVGTLTNWKEINTGESHAHAIKTDGTLWAWGYNQYGVIGNSTISNQYVSPIQIGTLTNWKSSYDGHQRAMAIKTDGTLWAWGFGNSGALGLGNTTNFSSPVQVGSLTNWKSVVSAGGDMSGFGIAIK